MSFASTFFNPNSVIQTERKSILYCKLQVIVTLLEANNQNTRAVSHPPGCLSLCVLIHRLFSGDSLKQLHVDWLLTGGLLYSLAGLLGTNVTHSTDIHSPTSMMGWDTCIFHVSCWQNIYPYGSSRTFLGSVTGV